VTSPPPGGPARRVPASAGEALEIGRTQFPASWPDGSAPRLQVHEFDTGYLVYATFPVSQDPNPLPPAAGGSNVVISKVNGDITDVPNYPPDEAVAVYRRFYRPAAPGGTA
jgi:hypothetical protein